LITKKKGGKEWGVDQQEGKKEWKTGTKIKGVKDSTRKEPARPTKSNQKTREPQEGRTNAEAHNKKKRAPEGLIGKGD